MRKIFLTIIILTGLFCSCKKYDEGPWVSFRSARHRLFGEYTLSQYTVNGIDSLEQYNEHLGTHYHFYYNEYNDYDACYIDGKKKDGQETNLSWLWDLKHFNRIFHIDEAISYSTVLHNGPFGADRTPEWEIIRLTDNEIKMKTNYNGKEYMIYLK